MIHVCINVQQTNQFHIAMATWLPYNTALASILDVLIIDIIIMLMYTSVTWTTWFICLIFIRTDLAIDCYSDSLPKLLPYSRTS